MQKNLDGAIEQTVDFVERSQFQDPDDVLPVPFSRREPGGLDIFEK